MRYGLLVSSILILACALGAWTGIWGAIFSEAQASSIYKELKDWQTLIGVGFACLTAWIAVLPVWRQVKETQRQAAGAAIVPLTKTVEKLEVERKVVFDARHATSPIPGLVDEYDNGDYHRIYQTWPETLWSLRAKLDDFRHQLQQHTDRHPDLGREIDGLRRETLKWIEQLHKTLGTLSHAFAQHTGGLAYEEGDEDLSDEVLKDVGKTVIDCLEGFEQFGWKLEIALGKEIPRVWGRIRELERAAVG
jgi:hypothetical protein